MKTPTRRLLWNVAVLSAAATLALATPSHQVPPTPKPPPPPVAGPIDKKVFHLGPWEHEIGYAQAVRVGNVLYVSGSTGGGDMPAAIRRAYSGIAATLAAHQLGFSHIVKETVFTTDIEALKANKAERNKFYGSDFPAATWVQVSRLFNPEHVIEVEVIAHFPEAAAR